MHVAACCEGCNLKRDESVFRWRCSENIPDDASGKLEVNKNLVFYCNNSRMKFYRRIYLGCGRFFLFRRGYDSEDGKPLVQVYGQRSIIWIVGANRGL